MERVEDLFERMRSLLKRGNDLAENMRKFAELKVIISKEDVSDADQNKTSGD